MTVSKRELEAVLLNRHHEIEIITDSLKILNEAISQVIEEHLNRGEKNRITDILYVAQIEAGRNLRVEYSDLVLGEVEKAKKRIEENKY